MREERKRLNTDWKWVVNTEKQRLCFAKYSINALHVKERTQSYQLSAIPHSTEVLRVTTTRLHHLFPNSSNKSKHEASSEAIILFTSSISRAKLLKPCSVWSSCVIRMQIVSNRGSWAYYSSRPRRAPTDAGT